MSTPKPLEFQKIYGFAKESDVHFEWGTSIAKSNVSAQSGTQEQSKTRSELTENQISEILKTLPLYNPPKIDTAKEALEEFRRCLDAKLRYYQNIINYLNNPNISHADKAFFYYRVAPKTEISAHIEANPDAETTRISLVTIELVLEMFKKYKIFLQRHLPTTNSNHLLDFLYIDSNFQIDTLKLVASRLFLDGKKVGKEQRSARTAAANIHSKGIKTLVDDYSRSSYLTDFKDFVELLAPYKGKGNDATYENLVSYFTNCQIDSTFVPGAKAINKIPLINNLANLLNPLGLRLNEFLKTINTIGQLTPTVASTWRSKHLSVQNIWVRAQEYYTKGGDTLTQKVHTKTENQLTNFDGQLYISIGLRYYYACEAAFNTLLKEYNDSQTKSVKPSGQTASSQSDQGESNSGKNKETFITASASAGASAGPTATTAEKGAAFATTAANSATVSNATGVASSTASTITANIPTTAPLDENAMGALLGASTKQKAARYEPNLFQYNASVSQVQTASSATSNSNANTSINAGKNLQNSQLRQLYDNLSSTQQDVLHRLLRKPLRHLPNDISFAEFVNLIQGVEDPNGHGVIGGLKGRISRSSTTGSHFRIDLPDTQQKWGNDAVQSTFSYVDLEVLPKAALPTATGGSFKPREGEHANLPHACRSLCIEALENAGITKESLLEIGIQVDNVSKKATPPKK